MDRCADHIISLAYHEHIPQPDPMAPPTTTIGVCTTRSTAFRRLSDGSMVAIASGTNPGGADGRTR
jgi:hypothetical protein